MIRDETVTNASGRLLELAGCLNREDGFAATVASLLAGDAATLDGAWGSSCALCAAALAAKAPASLVIVTAHLDQIDDWVEDLALFTAIRPERFPAWETTPSEESQLDEITGDRLRLLKLLQGQEPPKLIVTCIQSLLQPAPSPDLLKQQTRALRVGDAAPIDELARWLVEHGFHNTTAVELPGEFSVRGGIVDIFAPDWFHPVRLEFFGDEIESVRSFEVAGQRSLMALDGVEVTVLGSLAGHRAHLADFLPPQSWFLLAEPGEIEDQAKKYRERLERADQCHTHAEVMRQILRFPSIAAWAVAPSSMETTCRLRIESVERFSGDIHRVRDQLQEAGAGQEVIVVCQTDAEAKRLDDVFTALPMRTEGRLAFAVGSLAQGFRLVSHRIALLSSSEMFRRNDLKRPSRRRQSRAIDSFLELRSGDLVVHLSHGIARYRGMEVLERGGQVEEHLALEFQGQTKLYVPASKIGLVQKYVGGTKGRAALAKLGGRSWQRQKDRVEASVTDMAADMLEMQAARAAQPGIAFPADTEWQREFDAAFPYHETNDQLTTIESIKEDMRRARPMDRLLCGDVGYGKTEVAMRAAFKAVDAGYQVAVLVPTTILAEQHHRTFSARMAEFPFAIASLSRFATGKQQNETIRRLADGSLDVVIGTHRLAQHDVQFHNLGLVIIDEEQRFGVEVKERLKALRRIVDVLTMTATPIPRTLHLGLIGVRDISNLETPPEDRLAVETRVCRFDRELIRHAVMRELNRGGQIFFVHNRVQDIELLAKRLKQIVPEASTAIAHGQMPEGELEQVMVDFVDHRFDMLLATTIVESGLDIPNANTIFIDEADNYGLADLHQLRGRVGRYKHRAYCYLLVDQNKHLSPTAARRLKAIEEFSDMGAGFAIAMRDLEIRGAGNILGTEQSGHIAAVGYELYCSLLEQAVAHLRHLPPKETIEVDLDIPIEAFIPRGYVPDMRLKIDLYRRLAGMSHREELADFRAELIDRFGEPPPPVEAMLMLFAMRIAAHRWQIRAIHVEDQYLVLRYLSPDRIRSLSQQTGGKLRIADAQSAYLPMNERTPSPETILKTLKSLLQLE